MCDNDYNEKKIAINVVAAFANELISQEVASIMSCLNYHNVYKYEYYSSKKKKVAVDRRARLNIFQMYVVYLLNFALDARNWT